MEQNQKDYKSIEDAATAAIEKGANEAGIALNKDRKRITLDLTPTQFLWVKVMYDYCNRATKSGRGSTSLVLLAMAAGHDGRENIVEQINNEFNKNHALYSTFFDELADVYEMHAPEYAKQPKVPDQQIDALIKQVLGL